MALKDLVVDHINAKWSREPIKVRKGTWMYEDRTGLTVVHEVTDGFGKYLRTVQVKIPWSRIVPSVRKRDAILRQKAEKAK